MRLRSLIFLVLALLNTSPSLLAAPVALSLQGSTSTFYPVFFRDAAWGNEQFVLALTRADIHTDETWSGSLMAEIRSHSSGWGHGSDFLDYTLYTAPGQGTQHLIAGIKHCYYEVGVVVWLRGGRTYYYSSTKPVTIRENSATGAELVTYENAQYNVREAFANKTSPDAELEANGVTFSRNHQVRGNFTSFGKVGVGTSTPSTALDVRGSGSEITANSLYFWGSSFAGDNIPYARLTEHWGMRFNSPDPRWVLSTKPSLLVGYAPDGRSWGNDNLYVLGNVGIGETNPQHKLAVNGTIKAKEIIVDTTGWSDYVFASDYRLAPLSEVEAHIIEKKHLPGIPSAAEVAEQGVSVGEMQTKLLAKIEELTLHQIAQEKTIKALQAQNNQLISNIEEIAQLRAEMQTLLNR